MFFMTAVADRKVGHVISKRQHQDLELELELSLFMARNITAHSGANSNKDKRDPDHDSGMQATRCKWWIRTGKKVQ